MQLPVWELTIARSGENYSFTLNNPNAGALSFRDSMQVPDAVRGDIVERIVGGLPPADDPSFEARLTDIGNLVFRRMLPTSIQGVLVKLAGGYLVVASDDPAIPWELAFLNGGFLGLHFAVARRIIARTLADAKARSERPSLEMLIIADPRGDLRAATGEARTIEKLFTEEPLVHVRVLPGKEATTRNVLDLLSASAFDILHYAGHVRADPQGQATLVLADGELTPSYLTSQFVSELPQIVFVNGCSSGAEVEDDRHAAGERIASMAETFITAGTGSYVGTLWDVPDGAASRVASRFYAELLEGAAVGDALCRARSAAIEQGAAGWASYVLYGRPSETIAGVQPVIERRRNLSGLRRLIVSGNEVERRQAAIRMGKLGLHEATKELAAACNDNSEAVRWRAVEGLAKIGTPDSINELSAYLGQADRDSILQVLVVARGKFGTEHWDAVSRLADPPHDRAIRTNAIAALNWMSHPNFRTRMASFLDDKDPLIQWTALSGLAGLGTLADIVLQNYQPEHPLLEKRRHRLLSGRPTASPQEECLSRTGVPVILDCDPGLDDSFAIALAALHPDCSLQAVSVVGGGNALVADGVQTASEVLQLCEREDVPVLAGMGPGGDRSGAERSKVFEQLAEIILRNGGQCVVVATGPLTNVAVLLRAFPQLVGAIKEIVFLGGSFSAAGNVGPVQEANVCADPEASSAVFRSGARIKVVPLELSRQLTIDDADAERLSDTGAGLLQQRLATMLAPLLAYYRVVFAQDGCPIHDALAMALALRAEIFTLRRAAITVELTGELTRGMTVRDERPEAEGDNVSSPIEVAEAVDLDAVRTLLDRVIPARPVPARVAATPPSPRPSRASW